jgi:hypothetical protein
MEQAVRNHRAEIAERATRLVTELAQVAADNVALYGKLALCEAEITRLQEEVDGLRRGLIAAGNEACQAKLEIGRLQAQAQAAKPKARKA